MSHTEKPRERLQKKGVSSLSNAELLAIILETGSKTESVVDLANKVISKFVDISEMREASLQELMQIKGIGLAKAAKVLAAIEISKRIGQQKKVRIPCHQRTSRWGRFGYARDELIITRALPLHIFEYEK